MLKNFGILFGFEWKKIMLRKSTWITFAALAIFLLFLDAAPYFGTIYRDGEPAETRAQSILTDRENGKKLSGRSIDDTLLAEMKAEYQKAADLLQEDLYFHEGFRQYKTVYQAIRQFSRESGFEPLALDEEGLYRARDAYLHRLYDEFGLSDTERTFWEEKDKKTEKPFVYQYARGVEYLVSRDGAYFPYLLASFFIAVCVGIIFSEEHVRRTDQLVLCSRFGRREVYFARMAAGCALSVCATVLLAAISVAVNFLIYGADGFSAMAALYIPYWPDTVTMGRLLWRMFGLLLASSVVTSVFAMLLSEVMRSSIGTMSVVIALLFLARLIPIPMNMRFLSQMWSYLPINFLKEGVYDLRMVFGRLTTWQFAPVLYLFATVVFLLIGKRAYCRYQVSGR